MSPKKDASRKKSLKSDRSTLGTSNPPPVDPPPPGDSADASAGSSKENSAKEKGGIRILDAGGGKPKPKRLSFNVTEENTIDWEPMKGGNRSELLAVLMADPEVRAAFVGAEGDETIEFTPEDIKEMLEKLSSFNASTTGFVFRRLRKWPIHPKVLDRAFTLPVGPKTDQLTQRGAGIANRYAPAFLKRYMNEILFVTGYIDLVKAQVNTAIDLQNRINAAEAARGDAGEVPAAAPVAQPAAGQDIGGPGHSQVPQ